MTQIMAPVVLFVLLVLSQSEAFAIERFLMSCKGALSAGARTHTVSPERRVVVGDNQILLRGKLLLFWETGMEDKTGWMIVDDWLRTQVTPNPYLQQQSLQNGDQLFILNRDGTLYREGYFGEKNEVSTKRILGRPIEFAPNLPRLYEDPSLTKVIIDDKEMIELFAAGSQAAAVKNLTPVDSANLEKWLTPGYEAYLQNLRQSDRLVRVGNRRFDQLAHFEEVVSGEISLQWGDRVYLLDRDGEVLEFIDLRVERMPTATVLKEKLQLAKKAIVIRAIRR